MIIKLSILSGTDKAYQLKSGLYIPKSVLTSEGLKPPYFKIKDWWYRIQWENVSLRLSELVCLRRKIKPTEEDRKYSHKVLQDISEMSIPWRELPDDVKEYWDKYWGMLITTPEIPTMKWNQGSGGMTVLKVKCQVVTNY